MPQRVINRTPANGGTGDTAYVFTGKINEDIAELYARGLADLPDVDIAGSPAPSDGDVLTYDESVSPPVWRAAAPTGGGSALTVKDEGSPVSAAVTSIDIVGAGASATAVGGAVTINISGSGGSLSDAAAHALFGGL